ncbi:MAG: hypothetical protein ABI175_08440 [Polyangiales bacterium]
MPTFARLTVALSLLVSTGHAVRAQPAPPSDPGDKGDAKALMASGLKLYAAKDYLGALSVFQTAYARFASGKILLNIGTTLLKLDRKAEAANAYQGYLDAADSDPAKKLEVTKVVAGLDLEVGVVEVTVTPADAEVQIDKAEWTAAAKLARTRVAPGSITVHARKTGFKSAELTATVAAGGTRAFALALEADVVATGGGGTGIDGGLIGRGETEEPPSKFGMLALAHVDFTNKGGAAIVGLAYDVIDRVQIQAAALLGPKSGGYAGVAVALLTGRVRPVIIAGMPIFVSNGARVGIRGAAGVELAFNRHISAVAELGVEHTFNSEPSVTKTLFIPAVGVIGRL